jgi:hypothetical protein
MMLYSHVNSTGNAPISHEPFQRVCNIDALPGVVKKWVRLCNYKVPTNSGTVSAPTAACQRRGVAF